MTIKEAILRSLEEIKEPTNYSKVCDHIIAKKYIDFGSAKTPNATVSAQLGDFIRNGDARIKRIKMPGNTYNYYLTKNESEINVDALAEAVSAPQNGTTKKAEKIKVYEERDLHRLLVTYLKSTDTFSKTIYHEQSKNGSDSNQTWTHPDIVGVKFLKLQTKASHNFLKAVNKTDTFKLSSYELKREINSDSELKKAFFQAVSNSSWANYGYLVAFEFADSLKEEMERLNQSFGIGIIELSSNPYQSKVLFPSHYRDLDFKTIDKLCKMNSEFQNFIEHCEKLMTADDRYITGTEKELSDICDKPLTTDQEIANYCKEKNIPVEDWALSETNLN
ncbi:MAG: hypothetical protein JSS76_04980 [Bacteroidetes bacterium]|nr:hypothetical protein [Bacteroidota bacterium]